MINIMYYKFRGIIMKSKLILVEGLPSSGKSTTAKMISEILKDYNINNELIVEGYLDHPADFDGVAYFDDEKFNTLIESFGDFKEDIKKITYKNKRGYFIEYNKGIKNHNINFPKELWTEIYSNDVYELHLSLHMDILKEKWTEFAKIAKGKEKVYIFDCSFIQNPVTVTMIRDNAKESLIIDYIKEIEGVIKDLNPILLYVDQNNIEKSFKGALANRPKDWLEFFINYYTSQGFGKAHKLQGLDGVIKILHERRKMEDKVLKSLSIDNYTLDNSEFDIIKHKKNIIKVLENLYLK